MKETLSNANFPRDTEGRVYHLNVKYGEVANRILIVGDAVRARKIAAWLDPEAEAGHPTFVHLSQRGFLTITGRYKGVPVTIMAIGMGNPMMDFFIRETRAIVVGTMAVIRFGSCGSLTPKAPTGSIVVPRGGYCIRRNIDYFCKEPLGDVNTPYHISGVFPADTDMTHRLVQKFIAAKSPTGPILTGGLNADGCSFYSSQGRQDPMFWDDNVGLIDQALAIYPDTHSLEMETSMLFHLAACSRDSSIRAAGCMQVFADRIGNDFIRPEVVAVLEPLAGKAVLETLVDTSIDQEMDEVGTVWQRRTKE